MLDKLSASIINKAQIIVLDGADGRDVPHLDRSSFDLQPNATSRGNDDLLIIGNPGISLVIEAVEHILWHGMLRNEYSQRSDEGEEAKGVALRYGSVEDLVKERSEKEGRIAYKKYNVPRVVFDNSLWRFEWAVGSKIRVVPTHK